MTELCHCGHVEQEHYQYFMNGVLTWICKSCDPFNKLGIDVGGDYVETSSRDPRFVDASDHEYLP